MAIGGPWTLQAVVQHYAWGREASESEVLDFCIYHLCILLICDDVLLVYRWPSWWSHLVSLWTRIFHTPSYGTFLCQRFHLIGMIFQNNNDTV